MWFRHTQPTGTTCTIRCAGIEFVGVAVKHPRDQFNRRLGRQLSFSRAVAHFAKDDRYAAWVEYSKRFPRDVPMVSRSPHSWRRRGFGGQ